MYTTGIVNTAHCIKLTTNITAVITTPAAIITGIAANTSDID
jgi:hypothetical protein